MLGRWVGGDAFSQMQKIGVQAEGKMRIAVLAIMSLKSSEHPSEELCRPLGECSEGRPGWRSTCGS